MTSVQVSYLALLRNALWNKVSQSTIKPNEISEIIRIAAFQGTGPLIYDQLLKLKDVDIPAELHLQMKQQCVSSMMQQQSMFATLRLAWTALKAADIHPILLKGFALAQSYPQPHLRQWGDIDLYVGQKQYHAACKVLQATFPNADHPEEEDEERKHYNFILPNTVLELHRISMAFAHPRDRKYYEGLEEKFLTKEGPSFDLEGLTITTPDETFNIFFVFLHAWHHFVETGMNMKQLCDLAILLHTKRDVIDKERLHKMLRKLHLTEPWLLIIYIMAQHLGADPSVCPFYTDKCSNRAESLFKRILNEGSSYKKDEIKADGVSYLKRKWLTLQSRLADSQRIRSFTPCYARHMMVSDIIHGLERTILGK